MTDLSIYDGVSSVEMEGSSNKAPALIPYKEFKFGEVITSDSGMPVLEVKIVTKALNEEGKYSIISEEIFGYLSPFRGYCFQVSKTVDGEWDLGSSQVIGLANVAVSDYRENFSPYYSNVKNDGILKELYKGQIWIALSKASRSNKVLMPKAFETDWEGPMHHFLDATLAYIRKVVSRRAAS